MALGGDERCGVGVDSRPDWTKAVIGLWGHRFGRGGFHGTVLAGCVGIGAYRWPMGGTPRHRPGGRTPADHFRQ